jgi:hypothetical protein
LQGSDASSTTVKLITLTGHILMDGSTVLNFEDIVGQVFAEAGFVVDASYGRPSSAFELVGLFNSGGWNWDE